MTENTTTPMQSERTNYRLSIAVGAACFLWILNFVALTPFFPFVAKDLNTSVALLGQVSGLVAFASIPVGMITGPLADRYGHRKVLLTGMSTLGVGSLITAIAPSYGVLMLMAPFGAVSQAIIRPLAVAIAGTHLAGDNRRGAVGHHSRHPDADHHRILRRMARVFRISYRPERTGNGLHGLEHPARCSNHRKCFASRLGLSAYASLVTDFPSMFLIGSSLVRSISLWGAGRSSCIRRVSFGFLTALNVLVTVYMAWSIGRDAPTTGSASHSRLGLSAYASLVTDFPSMFLIGSSLVRSISLWGFNTYRGAFFVWISTQEVGWIFTMAGMGLLLGGAVASSRFSRLPLYWLAIVGTAAIGLGGGLALVLPLGILPAIALTILTSFGLGFSLVATDTLIVNRAVGQRATATSLNRVSTNIGVAVGSSGGGLMIAVDGYPLLGTTVLGFGAAALILLWLSRSSGRASSEPAS